jgi:signal transduction histidine kinase
MPFRNLARRLLLRLPRRTVRLRLTVVYAALFLASGAGLLAITYVLVRHATGDVIFGTTSAGRSFVVSNGAKQSAPVNGAQSGPVAEGITSEPGATLPRLTPQQGKLITPQQGKLIRQQLKAQARRDLALAKRQRNAEMRQLLEQSGVALAIMAALSIGLGWLAAGRVLRPLRTLNERAREISASNLHKRLGLTGPDDELKQLANTFDDLLGRLEASFQAQRQFVANASHELRTPLTLERALVEVALADPNATADTLRETCERVLATGEQQERLIEALLTLSRSQRGLDHHEPFDLAAVADEVLLTRRTEAERQRLRIDAALEPAPTTGDPRLGERLVANLVDNAVRHNVSAGRIEVATGTRAGHAVLSITNSGPVVPSAEVDRLFQPFQRLAADRNGHDDGLGLGLSIVHAIATAHGATLTARAQPAGGLDVEVSFPPPLPTPAAAVV